MDEVWTTRDGRRIPVREMSNRHLLNLVQFLCRRTEARRSELLFMMDRYAADAPDGAAMAVETEMTALATATAEEVWSEYGFLWNEARKRGLIVAKEK